MQHQFVFLHALVLILQHSLLLQPARLPILLNRFPFLLLTLTPYPFITLTLLHHLVEGAVIHHLIYFLLNPRRRTLGFRRVLVILGLNIQIGIRSFQQVILFETVLPFMTRALPLLEIEQILLNLGGRQSLIQFVSLALAILILGVGNGEVVVSVPAFFVLRMSGLFDAEVLFLVVDLGLAGLIVDRFEEFLGNDGVRRF